MSEPGYGYDIRWMRTTLHDFLSAIHEPPSVMRYALITCVDSSYDLPELLGCSPWFKARSKQFNLVGKAAQTRTADLLESMRETRLFHGFDEVFFSSKRFTEDKPQRCTLVGPSPSSSTQLEELQSWMRQQGSSLGLGDGVGLTICARVRGVGRLFLDALAQSGQEALAARKGA